MLDPSEPTKATLHQIVTATGEEPISHSGGRIKISTRFPIGPFRVPNRIQGKRGIVNAVLLVGLDLGIRHGTAADHLAATEAIKSAFYSTRG